MVKVIDALLVAVGGIAFLVFLSFLFSLPVYLLWNGCLVGAVNSVNEITWLQAWGINILSGFLFKTTVNKTN
jgi:hypothetical protein